MEAGIQAHLQCQKLVALRNVFCTACLLLQLPIRQDTQTCPTRVQLSFLSWLNSLDTSVFCPDTFWATVVNILEEYCPIRHRCLLSMELVSFFLFFPTSKSFFFVILSLVSVFYIVILWLHCPPLPLGCVCVCVYSLKPYRGLYMSLALSALPLLCQLCALEHLWVCMYVCVCAHESVLMHSTCRRTCAFAYHVFMCVCLWDCGQLLFAKTQLLSVSVHCVQCCVQWPWAFGHYREQCRIDNSQTIAGIPCGPVGWDTYHVCVEPAVGVHLIICSYIPSRKTFLPFSIVHTMQYPNHGK